MFLNRRQQFILLIGFVGLVAITLISIVGYALISSNKPAEYTPISVIFFEKSVPSRARPEFTELLKQYDNTLKIEETSSEQAVNEYVSMLEKDNSPTSKSLLELYREDPNSFKLPSSIKVSTQNPANAKEIRAKLKQFDDQLTKRYVLSRSEIEIRNVTAQNE